MPTLRPFELPPEPIDKYRVTWWTVDWLVDTVRISQCVAIYHLNSTWKDIMGDDGNGADFVNHWQIFQDGSFTGRTNDGWDKPWARCAWSDAYGTRAEAVEHAKSECRVRINYAVAKVEQLQAVLAQLKADAATHEVHPDAPA